LINFQTSDRRTEVTRQINILETTQLDCDNYLDKYTVEHTQDHCSRRVWAGLGIWNRRVRSIRITQDLTHLLIPRISLKSSVTYLVNTVHTINYESNGYLILFVIVFRLIFLIYFRLNITTFNGIYEKRIKTNS